MREASPNRSVAGATVGEVLSLDRVVVEAAPAGSRVRFFFSAQSGRARWAFSCAYSLNIPLISGDPFVLSVLSHAGMALLGVLAVGIRCQVAENRLFRMTPWQQGFWRRTLGRLGREIGYSVGCDFVPPVLRSFGPLSTSFRLEPADRTLLSNGCGKESAACISLLQEAGILFDEMRIRRYPSDPTYRSPTSREVLRVEWGRLKFEPPSLSFLSQLFMPAMFFPAQFFVPLLFCRQRGFRTVIFGFEHSANYPNARWRGGTINHQYTKSSPFLRSLNAYIHRSITPDVSYVSPLHAFSEFRIMSFLARQRVDLGQIISCNFAQIGKRWCCNCPKCAFTFLLARAFFPKKEVLRAFGQNMFSQVGLFRPLIDLDGRKPLECVGEKEESWMALYRCCQAGCDEPVVRYFRASILPAILNHLPKIAAKVNRRYAISSFAGVPADGAGRSLGSAAARQAILRLQRHGLVRGGG